MVILPVKAGMTVKYTYLFVNAHYQTNICIRFKNCRSINILLDFLKKVPPQSNLRLSAVVGAASFASPVGVGAAVRLTLCCSETSFPPPSARLCLSAPEDSSVLIKGLYRPDTSLGVRETHLRSAWWRSGRRVRFNKAGLISFGRGFCLCGPAAH